MIGETRSGTCLCGSVRIGATPTGESVTACHCGMCRTWGGGPMLAVDGGTDLRIDGEEHVVIFRSSEWAERAFCQHCGTHLFYRLVETGEYEIPVGLLGDAGWSFDQQIFVDERPSFYDFRNDTTNLTGAEVFARYTGASD